jgi:hypothetical protein
MMVILSPRALARRSESMNAGVDLILQRSPSGRDRIMSTLTGHSWFTARL